MAKFYIEQLIVSGGGHTSSIVDFKIGLNLIVGPSNTGKTTVINCIDYLMGFKEEIGKEFLFDKTLGYDNFKMIVRTVNGTVIFERGLSQINANISISGTDTNFEAGEYSIGHSAKLNINDVWLKLMGIGDKHMILSSQTGSENQLTLRAMLHMFMIKQDDIARTTSVLLCPNKSGKYESDPASKAITLFLMTGQDAGDIKKEETPEKSNIRRAKKVAVIQYINDTISKLARREGELSKQCEEGNTNLQDGITSIKSEIDILQQQINEAVSKSKKLMHGIYDQNGKLAECDTISERFSALRSQYHSDVERLAFIVEGSNGKALLQLNNKCPFCENEITGATDELYMDAARSELANIRIHLLELDKAEKEIASKQKTIQNVVKQLETEKKDADTLVNTVLIPRIDGLQTKLANYRHAIELSKELEIIKEEERNLSLEVKEMKETKDAPAVKLDIFAYFDEEQMLKFSEKLKSILEVCQYKGANSAWFNLRETFDLEIGGKPKKSISGGGHCAFLNTIIALSFAELLEETGKYSPGLFISDSPLSQLSEAHITDAEKMKTIKAGFLKYLTSDVGEESTESNEPFPPQLIIVEHPERLSFSIADYPNVNLIEFSHLQNEGRYGFLNEVF